MKANFLKFYTAVFFFCSTMIAFAAPGDTNDTNDLEAVDAPAPIGDYLWVLLAVGLFFAFMKYRSLKKAV
jgi:hydrogenase/urease accessory protein HupE